MITIPDYNTVIWPQVLAFFRNRFPGKDTSPESFLGKLARAVARSISYWLVSLQSVDQDAVPSQKTSFTALANMAYAYGLPSNLGGYGANGATAASGGVIACTGTNGTVYPSGLFLTGPDGTTIFKTTSTVTIPGIPPGTGSISCPVVAVTTGTVGNLPSGNVLTWQSPPSGSDSSAALTTGLSGAIDVETRPALYNRVLARWQNPPKGGTAQDYRTWAESISGVYRAYVYPLRHGTGSVDVVLTTAGSGASRAPGAATQTAVASYINSVRPVTSSGVNVLLPYVGATGLTIRVRVVPSKALYAFDWALGNSTFTVASYASGPPGVITMNQSLPASLTQAVDNYQASPSIYSAPRLQVMSTGLPAPGIATPVRVVAYNAGAKTLTLENPLPAGWTTPSGGDAVYPYGGAVSLIAPSVLAYVDSLGPSRASSYADPRDAWSDTCSIFSIGEMALVATDTDGITHPASQLLGVTINGGTSDVQATDTPANGVQLLTVAKIAITD